MAKKKEIKGDWKKNFSKLIDGFTVVAISLVAQHYGNSQFYLAAGPLFGQIKNAAKHGLLGKQVLELIELLK